MILTESGAKEGREVVMKGRKEFSVGHVWFEIMTKQRMCEMRGMTGWKGSSLAVQRNLQVINIEC